MELAVQWAVLAAGSGSKCQLMVLFICMDFGRGVIPFIRRYDTHKEEINRYLCKCTALCMVVCGREREK